MSDRETARSQRGDTVPNTLHKGHDYQPQPTTRQLLQRAVQAELRRRAGITRTGHRLADVSLRLLQVAECPIGRASEHGYNDLGCRCTFCREAHRVARNERNHRRAA